MCFCGTENIFCDITYFPHICTTFVVPFVFWYTKMLTLTILSSKSLRSMAENLYTDLKVIIICFVEEKKIFCDITYFPQKCTHLCGSLCILVYKNADVWQFCTQNLLKCMAKNLYTDLIGLYNVFCGTEIIFCLYYVFSLQMHHLCGSLSYFGIQKCWR